MPGTRRNPEIGTDAPVTVSVNARQLDRVFAVVAAIPSGRVTTYGAIARAIGQPRGARAVGWALHQAAGDDLPCHRVVNRIGFLSGGWHFGHPDVMAGLLRAEGVPFVDEYQVDLGACLWLPEVVDVGGDAQGDEDKVLGSAADL
jgi:methylated-DNA-protein-cysteine methyltransferase related protein